MKYKIFRIEHYKGIELAEFQFKDDNLICFIGGNEAGKTTFLDALRNFDYFLKNNTINGRLNSMRPRQLRFDNTIKLTATLGNGKHEYKISYCFEFKENQCRRKYILISIDEGIDTELNLDDVVSLSNNEYLKVIREGTPNVLYFDDFIFSVPEKIRFIGSKVSLEQELAKAANAEQRKEFAFLETSNNIYWQNIFDDLVKGGTKKAYSSFQKHVIDIQARDGDTASDILIGMNEYLNISVRDTWQGLFLTQIPFKEFKISPISGTGLFHDYTIKVVSNDGTTFDLYDRSKGFRWFFCFKLLTEVRSNRGDTMFLLDEPANNLHYISQNEILKTLESLSTKGENVVLYSTHSPVLIPQNQRTIAVINDAAEDSKKPIIQYIDLASTDIKNLMNDKNKSHYQNIGLVLRSVIENQFSKKEKEGDIISIFKGFLKEKGLDALHKISVISDIVLRWFI